METEVVTVTYNPEMSSVAQNSQSQTAKMPLRILDPGRSKLSTVETKRIISVLDDTILKVEIVCMLAYVIQHLEEFVVTFGPIIFGALKHHLRLSNELEFTLMRLEIEGLLHRAEFKGEIFGAEDPGGVIHLQVQNLKSNVRNLVRLFYANPIACLAMREAHKRTPASSLFIRCFTELRGFLYEMLLTTPLEEKEKQRFIQELTQRDKKNSETIQALEDELAAAIKNRDEEVWGHIGLP